jgi:HNH endonuclease
MPLTLEIHHLDPVSVGGADTPDNLLCLCPNCHTMHHKGIIPVESLKTWKVLLLSLNEAFDRRAVDILLAIDALGDVAVTGDGMLVSDALRLDDLRAALDNKGNALLAWTQYDGQRDNLWSAAWGVSEPLSGSPQLVEHHDEGSIREVSRIALAEEGMGVVAYTQEQPYTAPDGSTSINEDVSVNIYHPGLGWGTPTYLEAEVTGDSRALSLAMNATGQTLIAWEHSLSGSPASTQVWAAHSTPSQGWISPQVLSDPVLEATGPPRLGWMPKARGSWCGTSRAGQGRSLVAYVRSHDGELGDGGQISPDPGQHSNSAWPMTVKPG